MLCSVKGNAQQVFSAFECPELIKLTEASDIYIEDFLKTPFFGTSALARIHYNAWQHKNASRYYIKGNASAGILKCLLGASPLKVKNESPEHYKQQVVCKNFAYIDSNPTPCALFVMYRRDNPEQWTIGLIKKTQAEPKYREILLLSCFDLTHKINRESHPEIKIRTDKEPLASNPLLNELYASIPPELLKHIFPKKKGLINKNLDRIDLILRYLNDTHHSIYLNDPVDFSKLNTDRLYSDNQALDLLLRYNVHQDLHLSFSMLLDCLSENSELRTAIEHIKFTNNEQINKNLLQMTLVFYEENKTDTLEKHQKLLTDYEFIRVFGGFMWDRVQIKLISVLYKKNYDHGLMKLILSEEAYFNAVSLLANMNYLQDVPILFKDEEKLRQLKYIYSLTDENTKQLCWIFWIKSNLSLENYKKIVQEAEKYPLMASTLIILDQKQIVDDGIIGLQKLAFEPRNHLKKSIKYQFFSQPGENFYTESLNELNEDELEAASKALSVLRSAEITDREHYRLVLDGIEQNKAKVLRIFLPQIANIPNAFYELEKIKELINVLYAGIIGGVAHQGEIIEQIPKETHRAAARNLCGRFICVTHLQELKFDDLTIEWTAQENNSKARYFRQIILRIEEQFKIISIHLNESGVNHEMHNEWRDSESKYRKRLYQITYSAFTNSKGTSKSSFEEIKQQIKTVEKEILTILDPPIHSPLHKAIIVLTNILISVFTLGIWNYIQYRQTGKPWFLTQTKSGEQISKLLGKDTLALLSLS
jgi:hypothetical protein